MKQIYKVRVSDKMVKQINKMKVFQSVTFDCLVHHPLASEAAPESRKHQFPSALAAQTVVVQGQ